MENSFWIPTLISVISLAWNYFQSKKIVKLETDAERKSLIHKYQFEKEFSIYTDLWAKLVDLKTATVRLRPSLDTTDNSKTEAEVKQERLENLDTKRFDVVEAFQKNKPFYSRDIYKEVEGVLKISTNEAIGYAIGRSHQDKYWETAEMNAKQIVDSMDKISNLIRRRIEVVEVN